MMLDIIGEKIEGIEEMDGTTGLDKKATVMDVEVEGEGVIASVEPLSQSKIDIHPRINTELKMVRTGMKWTRRKKVKSFRHPPVQTALSGDGDSGDMNGKVESDVPNLLQESLPFTRCKIVLNLWEEEDTENLNQGWRREESGFVFYDGITTHEKEEFQKLLPIIKDIDMGVGREEQSPEVAICQNGVKTGLMEKSVNGSVGKRNISQNKGEMKCRSPTKNPHWNTSNLVDNCVSVNSSLSVDELPNKQSVMVEIKITPTPTNLDETENARKSSPADSIYRCPYCFKTFLEAGSLIEHLPLHSRPKVKQEEQHERKTQQILDAVPPSIIDKESSKHARKLGVKASNSPESENKAGIHPFKCNHCDQSFKTFKGFRLHEVRRHKGLVRKGPTLHKCLYCNYSTIALSIVQKHMKLHTEEGRPFKCTRCSCSFKFSKYLGMHISRFHNPIKIQGQKSSLHLKKYQTGRVLNVREPTDKSNFETSKLILKESNSQVEVINGGKPETSQIVENAASNKIPQQNFVILKLTRCDNLLKQYGLLPNGSRDKSMTAPEVKTDSQLKYSNTTSFKSSTHPQKKNALSHWKNIEVVKSVGASNKWKCKICETIFSSTTNINRHLKNHLGVRLVCTYCQSTFSRKYALKRHVEKVHENNATLSEGQNQPKPSSHPNPLGRQLLKTLAPESRPKCTYCQMEFKHSSYLVRHVKMIHLGMKRHKCSHCDKLFRDSSSLKRHFLKRHSISDIMKVC